MGKRSAAGLLTSVDSIFTTQEERDNAQRSYVIDLQPEKISDFPNHPFKVRMDQSMAELADSVKQHGVLVPSLVRPMPNGSYQMVSGHRRKRAAELAGLPGAVKVKGAKTLCETLGVGEPTLNDIVAELCKPGRDVRDSLPKPLLRSDVMGLDDLKPGMELTGTVRNVIDFGAFVDLGVHQDGLVHVSQISDKFIKHPREVLKVGDIVRVKVLSVDTGKKRIALTMKGVPQQN